jgi:Right handed beta helix region
VHGAGTAGIRFIETFIDRFPIPSHHVDVTQNELTGGAGAGIVSNTNTLADSLISENTTSENLRNGINLLGGNTENVVRGNHADNNGFSGITANLGATGNRFEQNSLHGNGSLTPTGADARDLGGGQGRARIEAAPKRIGGAQLSPGWLADFVASPQDAFECEPAICAASYPRSPSSAPRRPRRRTDAAVASWTSGWLPLTSIAFGRTTVASQSETAAATARLFRNEWVPGMRATVRFGLSDGVPKGSLSPWTTSVGTVTASSSGRRLFSGRPGGWTGNARHKTAIEPVSSAVRHATRAPDDRPPVRTGRPLSRPSRSCETTAVQDASSWPAGAGLRFPATR